MSHAVSQSIAADIQPCDQDTMHTTLYTITYTICILAKYKGCFIIYFFSVCVQD